MLRPSAHDTIAKQRATISFFSAAAAAAAFAARIFAYKKKRVRAISYATRLRDDCNNIHLF